MELLTYSIQKKAMKSKKKLQEQKLRVGIMPFGFLGNFSLRFEKSQFIYKRNSIGIWNITRISSIQLATIHHFINLHEKRRKQLIMKLIL